MGVQYLQACDTSLVQCVQRYQQLCRPAPHSFFGHALTTRVQLAPLRWPLWPQRAGWRRALHNSLAVSGGSVKDDSKLITVVSDVPDGQVELIKQNIMIDLQGLYNVETIYLVEPGVLSNILDSIKLGKSWKGPHKVMDSGL